MAAATADHEGPVQPGRRIRVLEGADVAPPMPPGMIDPRPSMPAGRPVAGRGQQGRTIDRPGRSSVSSSAPRIGGRSGG